MYHYAPYLLLLENRMQHMIFRFAMVYPDGRVHIIMQGKDSFEYNESEFTLEESLLQKVRAFADEKAAWIAKNKDFFPIHVPESWRYAPCYAMRIGHSFWGLENVMWGFEEHFDESSEFPVVNELLGLAEMKLFKNAHGGVKLGFLQSL